MMHGQKNIKVMYQLWMHYTVFIFVCAVTKTTRRYCPSPPHRPPTPLQVSECRWISPECQLTMSLLFSLLRPKLISCHLIIFNVCVKNFSHSKKSKTCIVCPQQIVSPCP
jgi:hypothetical protein